MSLRRAVRRSASRRRARRLGALLRRHLRALRWPLPRRCSPPPPREAGDVLATVVFASSALLLAGVVAVTTVPYLARRVVGSHVRDALNYEVTRAGPRLSGSHPADRHRRAQHRQQPAVHRGGRHARRGAGQRHRLGGDDQRAGNGSASSASCLCRAELCRRGAASQPAPASGRSPSPWCRRVTRRSAPPGAGIAPNSSILRRASGARPSSAVPDFTCTESCAAAPVAARL